MGNDYEPDDKELEAFTKATRARLLETPPYLLHPMGTLYDLEYVMRLAAFEYFRIIGSKKRPGMVYILIGHDDYILHELVQALTEIKPMTICIKIIDCNGYSQEVY